MTKRNMGLAVITMVLIGAFGGGCQDGNAGKSTENPMEKMNRVLSAENRQLKEQIQTMEGQIGQQKEQLGECAKEKEEIAKCEEIKKQLEKCEKEKDAITKEKKGNYEELLEAMTENAAKVTAENEALKTELAKLKGEEAVEPNASEKEPAQAEPNEVQ